MTTEYDVAVIGAGPGGYTAALRASALGLKTVCIDKGAQPGGTCLNVGCIPSKSLLHASLHYDTIKEHAKELGLSVGDLDYDLAAMMRNKEQVVSQFQQGIHTLFANGKVDYIEGTAAFINPTQIQVGATIIQAKHTIIATGSSPVELPFMPFDGKHILSSTDMLALKEVPRHLVVVGGGVIGLELGSVYRRLGAKVTVVEFMDSICPEFDSTIKQTFAKILSKQGMDIHTKAKATGCTIQNDQVTLSCEIEGKLTEIICDQVLVAVGRRPYTNQLGIENIDLTTNAKGQIPVNEAFQTAQSNIYAIGDVIDGPMLAHKAEREGVCVAEIIAGRSPHINYAAIPSVVYTHPEVAWVGLTEEACKQHNIPYKVARSKNIANARAVMTQDADGLVKLIYHKENGQLLGAHIIGALAGDQITACTLAIAKKLTIQELATTIHPHPATCEVIQHAAMSALT
ncbi:MAG: Dihydrolipoyl dehydrogenase 3 [Chlamydiia bacterium]|nr:Dihydrolipoyl dehydrogenase 3 [Chlamydiia bacterium]